MSSNIAHAINAAHEAVESARREGVTHAIGSDDEPKAMFMHYFDERGVSRKYDVKIEGNTVTWRRDDPKFSQSMTITVAAGGNRMVNRGRMSRDGAPWEEDLSLTYERISKAGVGR